MTSMRQFVTAILILIACCAAAAPDADSMAAGRAVAARGEEAIRKYLNYKPAEDEPALASAWYWLGMIQEKQGKKAEARQSYLNALKLAPDAKNINEALKRVS